MPKRKQLTLTDFQWMVFDRLMDMGVPVDWSLLIAEKSEESFDSVVMTKMIRDSIHPGRVLSCAFLWSESEEGWDFWSSVAEAFNDAYLHQCESFWPSRN